MWSIHHPSDWNINWCSKVNLILSSMPSDITILSLSFYEKKFSHFQNGCHSRLLAPPFFQWKLSVWHANWYISLFLATYQQSNRLDLNALGQAIKFCLAHKKQLHQRSHWIVVANWCKLSCSLIRQAVMHWKRKQPNARQHQQSYRRPSALRQRTPPNNDDVNSCKCSCKPLAREVEAGKLHQMQQVSCI